MHKGDFLFVYGTLRRGEYADLQKQSHKFGADFRGVDYINGKMYHLGAYPGVKAVEQGRFNETLPVITGEVFCIREAALVAILDAFEGYLADTPKFGLYDRIKTTTASGKTVWVYVYNHPVTADQLIDSGDWCKNRDIHASRHLKRA